MAYKTPKVGDILPAQENTTVENPGSSKGPAALNEWLQAQAQDTAWRNNQTLVDDWKTQQNASPDYAATLGAAASWAVVVIEPEIGGIAFDQQRCGPAVSTLEGA